MHGTAERILVTGGAGRLGRLAVEELGRSGFSVLSLDKAAWTGEPRSHVRELVGDLLDFRVVREAMSGVSIAVHLGAELLPTKHCLRTNQESTWNVLIAATEMGVGRVIYASSVYAFGRHWGFTVDQYPDGYELEEIRSVPSFPITEDSPPAPRDPYSVSKLLNEQTARAVSKAHRLETVGLRFGDIWFDALASWWEHPPEPDRPAMGQKFDFWNYVDAADAVRAVVAAVQLERVPEPLVLLIMANDTQVREATREAIARSFPELLDRVPEDLLGRASLFSNARAKQILAWVPQVSWTDFQPR